MNRLGSFIVAAALGFGGAAGLVGCGSAGGGDTALFAGGDGWFGESPAKPGLYDDHGWPVQQASAKTAPGRNAKDSAR
jgi:hypothetical protein